MKNSENRLCAYDGKEFTPVVFWQKFCKPSCRVRFCEDTKAGKSINSQTNPLIDTMQNEEIFTKKDRQLEKATEKCEKFQDEIARMKKEIEQVETAAEKTSKKYEDENAEQKKKIAELEKELEKKGEVLKVAEVATVIAKKVIYSRVAETKWIATGIPETLPPPDDIKNCKTVKTWWQHRWECEVTENDEEQIKLLKKHDFKIKNL